MRLLLGTLMLLICVCATGCGESKPDPRDRPDFVDTSDPSKLDLLPALPPEGPGAGQKAPSP